MNRRFLNILAAMAAVLLLLTALPFSALAEGETGVMAPASQDPNDQNDKDIYYKMPTAIVGDQIMIYVPVQCTGSVERVACAAVDEEFPPELQKPASLAAVSVNGDAVIASLSDTQKAYFAFTFKVADKAKAGSYDLKAKVTYQVGGVDQELSVSTRFRVKAADPTPTPVVTEAPVAETVVIEESTSSGGSSGGSGYRTKPKVIIDSYYFDTDKLYAGEQVTLSLRLRNTSTREAVRNLELKFSNEAGVIMPVSGGSTSVYIGELKKETVATIQIPLEIAPDAEAKAQTLALEVVYEGTRNKQEFTDKSSITAQVYQRARVRTDQPVVYDEAWVGQTVSMSVQMFNMGKSTLYNCMVEVHGEGLSLEETYYGGNVAPGSTMRADLTLKTDVAGTIAGTVDILYEDVFGEQSVETLPFTVEVNEEPAPMSEEEMAAMAGVEANADKDGAQGVLRYWWVAAAVVAIVLLLVLARALKRRRARQLLDELPEDAQTASGDEAPQPDAGETGLAAKAGEDGAPDDRTEA